MFCSNAYVEFFKAASSNFCDSTRVRESGPIISDKDKRRRLSRINSAPTIADSMMIYSKDSSSDMDQSTLAPSIQSPPLAHCRQSCQLPPEYTDTCTPPPYYSVLKDLQDEHRLQRIHQIRGSLWMCMSNIKHFCIIIANGDIVSSFLASITAVITIVLVDDPPNPWAIIMPICYLAAAVIGRLGIKHHRQDIVNAYLVSYCCRYLVDLLTIVMALYRGESWPWSLPLESTLLTLLCVGVRPLYAQFYPCGSFWRGQLHNECIRTGQQVMSPAFKAIVFMLTPHLFAVCLLISFATLLTLHTRRRDQDDLIPTYSQTIEQIYPETQENSMYAAL